MLGVVVAVMGVSATGITAYNIWDAARTVAENSVLLPADKELPPSLDAIEGGVNLLMVGTDSCEGENAALSTACQSGDTDGERNDVTMLVHISDEPRRVTVVSLPRDMLEPIPSCPKEDGSGNYSAMSSQKLNVSYSYGGLTCTVMTVEAITKQQIDFAAAIRWSGVIAMSDAIGGVDVCIGAGGISDPEHTGLTLSEGEHTLQGWEALQFLRIRHGIGDGSDLGRISNQQQFMSSMVRKLQSDAVLADPARLLTLATTAIGQMQKKELVLSSGLANPTLMVQIAMAVKNVPFQDIVFVQYPTRYSSDYKQLYPVKEAADQLFAALDANEPLTLTGDSSQGSGVEVTGEVAQPGATPAPSASADAGTPAPEQRVELPSTIAGQTADQTTCTVKGK
ncbi:LCP family protein [Microbacterium jejuense]|uniref:LCP family protein n=1 Tax=Microbacterium jejuense TaxID=1263637 RepID=UPI0031E83C07